MNRIFILYVSLFYFIVVSCEQADIRSETNVWQGTEDSFDNEFSFQPDLTNDQIILTRNGSNELYSGFLEINRSGSITEQNYREGRLNGKSIKKSADGSWVEANYVDGKLDGSMKLYDRFGKLRTSLTYTKGKLLPSKSQ